MAEEATKPVRVQRVRQIKDIDTLQFFDGLAAVEVPIEVVKQIEFKNDKRGDSPRLWNLERSIRDHGFDPTVPIISRIGRRGRWVIVDGGHRLVAARKVSEEWLPNLLHTKVTNLYFLLFTVESSWSKVKRIATQAAATSEHEAPDLPDKPPPLPGDDGE